VAVIPIPADSQYIGAPNHTPDHNSTYDTLALLATIAAQNGGGPAGLITTPVTVAGANATAIPALESMAGWLPSAGVNAPWQFPVSAYGAKGDGKVVTDGVILSGSLGTLTCATSHPFTTADAGKSILISTGSTGGNPNFTPFATTISGVISATQVTLQSPSPTPTPTTGTTPTVIVAWATDDTAAINAAVTAAYQYASSVANQGSYAEIIFDSVLYGVAAAPQTGAGTTTYGNAQIPLPFAPPTSEKVILVFTSRTKGIDQALVHWAQTVPQTTGAVLMCLSTAGTSNATYGPSSMIGGPYYNAAATNPGPAFGGDLGLFSNMMPVVDGIQLLVPFNSTIGGFDFFGCAEATVINGSCMAMAVVNIQGVTTPTYGTPTIYPNMYGSGVGTVGSISGYASLTNTWPCGLKMPVTGNNDRCDVLYYSCEGIYNGFMPSEHASVDTIRAIYCYYGILAYTGGIAMPHAMRIKYVSCEGSYAAAAILAGDSAVGMDIDTLDTESCYVDVYDPGNHGTGYIGLRTLGSGTPGYAAAALSNGGNGFKIVCLDNSALAGVQTSGAPAAPGSGTTQPNWYYRDATVYVRSTGAAGITSIAVSNPAGTSTAITAFASVPQNTWVPVPVPAGKSYTVTYSNAGALQTQWVLF